MKSMVQKTDILRALWDEVNSRLNFATSRAILCESYIDAAHYAVDSMAQWAYDHEFIEENDLREIQWINDTVRAECMDSVIEREKLAEAAKAASEVIVWGM